MYGNNTGNFTNLYVSEKINRVHDYINTPIFFFQASDIDIRMETLVRILVIIFIRKYSVYIKIEMENL